MDRSPSSSDIAAEEDRVRRRRSTMSMGGRRSCYSVGGRLSLAAPPAPGLQDQVLRVEESRPWATKLTQLLDIALREAVRRLETRLSGDECVPELRAAVLTQSRSLAQQLSDKVFDLMPAAVDDVDGQSTLGKSANVDVYKEKTKALEQEYSKWTSMRRQREAECRAVEIELKEAKSAVTTMDEGQEVHLSSAQRNLLNSWPDCSHYIEEAKQAKETAHLVIKEVRQTTEMVNGLLTAARLQADSSYSALESLSTSHIMTQPLPSLVNSLLQHHLTCPSGGNESQTLADH